MNKKEEISQIDEGLRFKLEQAHRILHMEGLAEDASRGHITVKTGDGRVYIKPWGVGFEEVKAEAFHEVDSDGNLLQGKGRMHSELPLHLEIYRKRKDVFSVAHVHPQNSIILSSVFKGKMHVISQHGVRFAGKIPFYRSPELIKTKELGVKLAKTLGDSPVILMKNHGFTAAGKTIEEAVILSIHFEQAARDHLMATLFGKPSGMPQTEIRKLSVNNYTVAQCEMLWDYYWKKFNNKEKSTFPGSPSF